MVTGGGEAQSPRCPSALTHLLTPRSTSQFISLPCLWGHLRSRLLIEAPLTCPTNEKNEGPVVQPQLLWAELHQNSDPFIHNQLPLKLCFQDGILSEGNSPAGSLVPEAPLQAQQSLTLELVDL